MNDVDTKPHEVRNRMEMFQDNKTAFLENVILDSFCICFFANKPINVW